MRLTMDAILIGLLTLGLWHHNWYPTHSTFWGWFDLVAAAFWFLTAAARYMETRER